MTNYLALIRKADFTDLFNFGKLHVNNDMKVDFKCDVEDLPLHKELFDALTLYANSFDNAFTYLIIHYCKEGSQGLSNDVYIEDVKHVYPLDSESKLNFESTFDVRIRIEEPLWSDAVLALQKQHMFIECKKGAQNLRQICGLIANSSECEKIITGDIVKEVVNELYEDIRPLGELSPWVYLLRYERHSYYPHNTVGCFMDMVNVMCNRHAQKEVEERDIQGTGIFQILNTYRNTDIKFEKLYGIINEQASNFVSMAKYYAPDVDFIKVASLFFILRNKFTDDFKYDSIFINHCKTYGKAFEIALYLLGVILGHKHTYDCMYEELPLAIFKPKPKNSVIVPSKMNGNQDEDSDDNNHIKPEGDKLPEAADQHEEAPQSPAEKPEDIAGTDAEEEKSPEAAGQHEETPQSPAKKPEDIAGTDAEEEKSPEAADQPEEVSQAPVEKPEDVTGKEPEVGKSPEAADLPEEVSQAPVEKPEDVTGKEPEVGKSAEAADQPEEAAQWPVEHSEEKTGEGSEIKESLEENHKSNESNNISSHNSPTRRIKPKFPCKMAKLKKDGKPKSGKNNVVIAKDLPEFIDYEKKGYVQYVESGQLFNN